MSRVGLFVGVDSYRVSTLRPLPGCGEDARQMAACLQRHGFSNGDDLNVSATLLTDETHTVVTAPVMHAELKQLFAPGREHELAVFYFSGHGIIDGEGFLVTGDSRGYPWGISLAQVLGMANGSDARDRLVILDCCHAGSIEAVFGSSARAGLADGVTVLAACRGEEVAVQAGGSGVFTRLILDALDGAAANPVTGEITVANVYGLVERALGGFEQRPMLKTNVSTSRVLRRVEPAIDRRIIRRLAEYFPDGAAMQLSPAFEPELPPADPEKELILADLQRLRPVGLVEPVDEEHLYYAAMRSKFVRLTALGNYYRMLAEKGLI